MRFYNRKEELGLLEKAYKREGADLIVISGRRRIGKSRVIDEFVKDKKAINVLIVPKEEKQLAQDFETEIRNKLGYCPSFSSFKDVLEYLFKQDVELICIDEFSNSLAVNQAIPHEMQRFWDIYKDKNNTLIILSGSYMGMMNKIFKERKAPLFNRATNSLNMLPLSFQTVLEILNDFGIKDPIIQVSYFCIFGGIPYYYLLLEKCEEKKEFSKSVYSLFFNMGAQLKEEGEILLKQEFGNAYSKYFAILEAINSGYVTMNEISQKLGIASSTLMKYMKTLHQDFKLITRFVPFNEKPSRSKKGLYSITDNTLAFWFSYVYGNHALPNMDKLNIFISRRFEMLCRNFFENFLACRKEQIVKTGSWWGSVEIEKGKFEQREIDVVVETDKFLYIGGCKWKNEKTGETELNALKESAKAILKQNRKPVKWVLFSKSGFNIEENSALIAFDCKKMIENA